ncbi:MAG: paraslipin [Deltaproteobacteria bacterium]|nr:paraslipin [Deltaproteobacteria bacterium]
MNQTMMDLFISFQGETPGLSALFNLLVWGGIFVSLVGAFLRSIRMVPTSKAFVVERLGLYSKTLGPGFHALIPVLDNVAFIRDLKEESITVPPQACFTSDNVQVEVDGVIYISVTDPVSASYGVTDYRYAATQLAQTTIRSVIGTLDLDKTFEERNLISAKIVEVVSEAGKSWGIRVHRYEVKNIQPPVTVKNAMEKQVSAERDRRAIIARSEGDRQSRINRSEGRKTELVNRSEGEMQRRINEAEGRAREVEAIAAATAESIDKLAAALSVPFGEHAVRLQLSQKYLGNLGTLGDRKAQVLLPADLSNLDGLLNSLGLSVPKD